MKNLIVLIILLFSVQVFGQSNKTIEKELYNHYKKTQSKFYKDEVNYEQVISENLIFISKLIEYLKREPLSIESEFHLLVKNYFKINSSPDHNFRIYSWFINLGGRYNFVYNIFQYRYKNKYGVWADKENSYEGGYVIDIFQTELNGNKYYLPYLQSPGSGRVSYQQIDNFRVTNEGIFNGDILFRNGEENNSNISLGFDFFSVVDREERPVKLISFDPETKNIIIPFIYPRTLIVSGRMEYYKFNGKQFEYSGAYFDKVELQKLGLIDKELLQYLKDCDMTNHFSKDELSNLSEYYTPALNFVYTAEVNLIKAMEKYLSNDINTMGYNFPNLQNAGMNIFYSADKSVRGYSFAVNLYIQPPQHVVYLFQTEKNNKSFVITTTNGQVNHFQKFLYFTDEDENNYYLAVYSGQNDEDNNYFLIQAFKIGKKQISKADIFLNRYSNNYRSDPEQRTNELVVIYKNNGYSNEPEIALDSYSKTLSIPYINSESEEFTGDYIKFLFGDKIFDKMSKQK